MEESHQKVIDELQRKHQRELENLQEEKERLLAEETAATIAGEFSQKWSLYSYQSAVALCRRVCLSFFLLLFFFEAIEAMKNAHRTELEKELDKARKSHSNTENADIDEIRRQHE